MTTDVSQLLRWADGLQRASGRIGAEVASEVRHTGETIAEESEATAPRGETGDLAASIEIIRTGSGRSREITMQVVATADHAHFVHYGTSRVRPRPWQDEALDAEVPAYLERLERIVQDVIPDE